MCVLDIHEFALDVLWISRSMFKIFSIIVGALRSSPLRLARAIAFSLFLIALLSTGIHFEYI